MKKETMERINTMSANLRAECEANIAENAKSMAQDDKNAEMQDSADTLHNMYNSYVVAGFTEDQAWELVKIAFTNATKRSIF